MGWMRFLSSQNARRPAKLGRCIAVGGSYVINAETKHAKDVIAADCPR